MAGGAALNPVGGKEHPGKMTLFVFLACAVASSGGLIFGYDIGISGGVTSMDSFLIKFFPSVYHKQQEHISTNQYCKFDSELLTMFTSSLYLAALIASFFAATVTRVFGRKWSMFGGGLTFLIGAVINGAAQNVAMLYIGRILLGIDVGFANQSVPVYLSEIAPARLRGTLNIGFQLMCTIGILVANLINYGTSKIEGGWGWQVGLGVAAVPALIITLGALFLPDNPNSLVDRGYDEKAKTMLRRIRGVDDVEEEYSDIVAASTESKSVQNPWANIIKRKNRPQFVMAILIPFFQRFTGMNVIMFYAPVLFKTIGFGQNAALMSSVITSLINVFATFVSIYFVDRAGRRILLLEGGIQMFLSDLFVGSIIWAKFGLSGEAEFSTVYAAIVVIFICIYVAGFAWSWGPLGWLIPSEIFPLEVRSAGQSINVSVNMLFTFVIAQGFLAMMCHMKFGLFFFFVGMIAIMTAFVHWFVPETKNIPIEEMIVVWKNHWFWRRFIEDGDINNIEMGSTRKIY